MSRVSDFDTSVYAVIHESPMTLIFTSAHDSPAAMFTIPGTFKLLCANFTWTSSPSDIGLEKSSAKNTAAVISDVGVFSGSTSKMLYFFSDQSMLTHQHRKKGHRYCLL